MFKRFLTFLFSSLAFSQVVLAQNESLQMEASESKTGYFNTTELSFAKGFPKENSGLYGGIQTINGYRFSEHISAGIGVGIDQSFYKNQEAPGYLAGETYLPVFTDVRLYLGKGNTRPFFSQAVGYTFCLLRQEEYRNTDFYKNKGGIMINPAFGINTPLSQKTSLNISVGYRFQEVTIKGFPFLMVDSNQILIVNEEFTASADYFTLKAGLTF